MVCRINFANPINKIMKHLSLLLPVVLASSVLSAVIPRDDGGSDTNVGDNRGDNGGNTNGGDGSGDNGNGNNDNNGGDSKILHDMLKKAGWTHHQGDFSADDSWGPENKQRTRVLYNEHGVPVQKLREDVVCPRPRDCGLYVETTPDGGITWVKHAVYRAGDDKWTPDPSAGQS